MVKFLCWSKVGLGGCWIVLAAAGVAGAQTSRPATALGPEPVVTGGRGSWLDEVVVTADRGAVAIFDTPYTVDVVKMQGFGQNVQPRTLTDALKDVPGVMTQKTASNQGSPYLRGFTGFRSLLLVDGIRLNNSVFRDGPNQYWNLVDPLTIDRLEVVKGPSSVLYGSDAVGGTVNAILRRPDEYGDGFQCYRQLYAQTATANQSFISRGEINATYGPWVGVLGGGTYKSFGDVNAGGDVGVQPKTGYQDGSGDIRVDGQPDKNTAWTVAHYQLYEDDAWRTHRTTYGTAWDGTDVGTDKKLVYDQGRSLTYGRYRKENMGGAVDAMELTFSFQQLDERMWRVRSNNQSEKSGFNVDTYGLAAQFESPSRVGRWTYGMEWYHDQVSSFTNRYKADGTFDKREIQGPVGDEASYDLLGLYVQDKIPLTERWDLTLGGRFNYVAADADKVKDPQTSRQISVEDQWQSLVGSVRLNHFLDKEEHWNVYGGVSQGFRAPNLSDLTRQDIARSGELETPSPNLEPERYLSYETGIKTRYDRFSAQAAYYYTVIDDMIVRKPTGEVIGKNREVIKTNAGSGYVQGVEFSGSYKLHPDWTAFGSFAWMYGEAEAFPTSAPSTRREPLDRLMPPMTRFGLRWDHPSRRFWAQLGCTLAATADKLSTADELDTQRIPPGGTPGYALLDLQAGWKICKDLDLWMALENMTDTDYRIHGSGLNEPGINLKAGLKWRF